MPTEFVKDEKAWTKAKKLAAEQGHAGDYAYIMGIYKKMTGQKKAAMELEAWADEVLEKAGPYIGPRGGKWADPQHKIPWKEKKHQGKPDPKPKEHDEHGATELQLYLENEYDLYSGLEAQRNNLVKHIARGKYDHAQAANAFLQVVDAASKKYRKEFGGAGGIGGHAFDQATRMAVARQMADDFHDEVKYGEHDHRLTGPNKKRASEGLAAIAAKHGQEAGAVVPKMSGTAARHAQQLSRGDSGLAVHGYSPKERKQLQAFAAAAHQGSALPSGVSLSTVQTMLRAEYSEAAQAAKHDPDSGAAEYAASIKQLYSTAQAMGKATKKASNPLEQWADKVLSKANNPFELVAQGVEEASCAQLMTELLGRLKALFWSHWTAHWQTVGPQFYADHELFTRLYGAVQCEIDKVAERAIGYYGNDVVDPFKVAAYERTNMQHNSNLVARALEQERLFMDYLSGMINTLKSRDKYTAGLEDLMPAIASTHDTHLYLLQQRQGA